MEDPHPAMGHGKGAARRNTARKKKEQVKRAAWRAADRALNGHAVVPGRPFAVSAVTQVNFGVLLRNL